MWRGSSSPTESSPGSDEEVQREERDIDGAPVRRRVAVALGVGLALVALAVVLALSGSPVMVLHANSTLAKGSIAETTSGATACQAGELLPAGTTAIRLALTAEIGPRVRVKALSGARVLTSGRVGNGWTGGSVTVPVTPLARPVSNARICFTLDPSKETVRLVGSTTPPSIAAKGGEGAALPGRIKIEYLSASSRSWWSMAPAIATRIGLDHAPSGAWLVWLLAVMAAGLAAAASWLVLRESR
jgi:hypothetical protein